MLITNMNIYSIMFFNNDSHVSFRSALQWVFKNEEIFNAILSNPHFSMLVCLINKEIFPYWSPKLLIFINLEVNFTGHWDKY